MPFVLRVHDREMPVASFAPKPQRRAIAPPFAYSALGDVGVELYVPANVDGARGNAPVLAIGASRNFDALKVRMVKPAERAEKQTG